MDDIEEDCRSLGLHESVCELAKRYLKDSAIPALENRSKSTIKAGCIYAACRRCGSSTSIHEISEYSGILEIDIREVYDTVTEHQDASTQRDDGEERPSYLRELGYYFRDTIPITLSFALQNITQAFSIFICGRLGTFELSVASYGYMFFSATATMIALGGSTAFDTLASQAFHSSQTAEKKSYVGVVLQRSLIFLTIIFFAVIAPVWWTSGALFRRLGQEGQFADATELFLKLMLPAGFAQVLAECFKKFLQVLNHRGAVSWCIGVGAIVGAAANWVLVLNTSLGLDGAPVAHMIFHVSTILAMLAFTLWNESVRTYWGGFSMKALLDPGPFVFLAISGIFTIATEFWMFETIALMASTIDSASIGAQSIIQTSDLIFATVPLGLSISSSHRVGKSLGANNASYARFQARIPYLVALCVGIVECILLLSLRNIYGRFFTDDDDVVRTTAKVIPLLAIFQCLDISNGGAAGTLRGAAKTHLAGVCNILGYYGIGLVLAWAYCFKLNWGLFGLWGGLITGSAALLVLQSIFVFTIKYDKEAEKILAKAEGREDDERAPLLGAVPEPLARIISNASNR